MPTIRPRSARAGRGRCGRTAVVDDAPGDAARGRARRAATRPRARVERTSDQRYGRRKPSSRKKVVRCGRAALTDTATPTVPQPIPRYVVEPAELVADERRAPAARRARFAGQIEPAARSGRVRKRDRDGAGDLEAAPDASVERRRPSEPAGGEAADRDDELRPQETQLPLAPERAEPLLARRRRAVAAAGRGATGIAARHRRAVERRVERVLVELEPAAQRLPGPAAPRAPLARPRRSRAPGRGGTRAGPDGPRAPEATRADSRPRAHARQRALSRCERRERAVGAAADGHDGVVG